MKKTILVTDTLFIFPEHEAKLRKAGFAIERLPQTRVTEAELAEAIKGKVGYIIGGNEKTTESVLRAADSLKAIVFTGAAWQHYVLAPELAAKKGILIANTPGANSYAVAEYALALMLMMTRRVLELGRPGKEPFITTSSLIDAEIGILGMGHIGERMARMLKGLGAAHVSYWNRTRKPQLEKELGIVYKSVADLVKESDIITNHLHSDAGTLLDAKALATAKQGVLLINAGGSEIFDMDAVYDALKAGHARAAFDVKLADTSFVKLPVWVCYFTNANAAYNTHAANKLASDMATDSIINMLTKGDDKFVVNKSS